MVDKPSHLFNTVKKLIPKAIKRSLSDKIHARMFQQVLKKIAQLSPGELPSTTLLSQLQAGWDNEGMAAEADYLLEVSRHAVTTKGAVLECGSGLTTLLLGLLAGARGMNISTLEHHAGWHALVSRALARHKIPGVNNYLAPLRSYGEFSWYEPAMERLPERFSLVVCDGPPGDTLGGRYGLVPVMQSFITSGTIILLDDADRSCEQEAIRRWQEIRNIDVVMHDQDRGQFAVITVM